MIDLGEIREIEFPAARYQDLVGHARRKLAGLHRPLEEAAPKAYGLLGGRWTGTSVAVTHVVPLVRNLRSAPHLKPHIDRLMEEWAVRSVTPLDRRGWVADPAEVLATQRACDEDGSVLFGAYHMHRVAWPHDPFRDTCTAIDRRLAEGSGLWALILSMVDPRRPILRAFFEGDNARETSVSVDAIPTVADVPTDAGVRAAIEPA